MKYCVDRINDYQCVCEDGFTGKNCQINKGRSQLIFLFKSFCLSLACKAKITLIAAPDDCEDAECANNSTCIDGVNKYRCDCLPGFSGDQCQNNINECDSQPCENGQCKDGINDFSCSCYQGYTGKTCRNCTNPKDCNISKGCCFGTIIFNSDRNTRSRNELLPYKNITEFFGLYKLFEFDEDRMIFQKDEDREVKKRISYNPEDEIWEVRIQTF